MPVSVSVVISSHNYGRFLREALDSALAQTYADVEVVVVDDGSTDDSREILASYGDRIVAVLTENGGQASALNAGVAASAGRVILFLDADDRLAPDAAAKLAGAWREGVARIQARVELVDGSGEPLGARLPRDDVPRLSAAVLVLSEGRYPATGTTGAAYDRRVLERLMPIPEAEWRRYPDIYLLLLAAFMGEAVFVEDVVGDVRLHGGNSWSLDSIEAAQMREHLECDARQERLLREWAPRLGYEVPEGWRDRIPNHLQVRLASLKLAPSAHPYPGDRASVLGLRGAMSSLRSVRLGPLRRVGMAGWFLAAAAAPRRWSPRTVSQGFLSYRRPRLVRALLG